MSGSIAWSFLMLAAVVAAIPASVWALKRLQQLRIGHEPQSLAIAGQLALGPRERVVMVRVDERVLVLGVTSQQVTLLIEHGDEWLRAQRQAA